ncbi:MAG: ABC transporter permease [Firmicutes bacterium]|nr:ABC transporter permease [Bacillota bacterium]
MWRYIFKRLVSLIPTVLGVSLIVFSLMHISGDPVRLMYGPNVAQEKVDERRAELGLDDPILVQYARWLFRAVQGDLGKSIRTNDRVTTMIGQRVEATLSLTILALLITLVISIPAGVISAVKPYSVFDNASRVFALFWVSAPNFWLGLIFILIFGVQLGWLPISGRHGPLWSVDGFLSHILPALTLGLPPAALFTRLIRSNMLEVIHEDYIRTARGKGLPETVIVVKHAMRNSLIPVMTLLGLRMPWLFGGAVVTETVFAWPGMGRLMVDSIMKRDYPVVQGAVLFLALLVVLANLLVDVMYAWVDPRIKYD